MPSGFQPHHTERCPLWRATPTTLIVPVRSDLVRIRDLSPAELSRLLRGEGLCLRIGRFVARVQSSLARVADHIAMLYRHWPLEQQNEFADFRVRLASGPGLRRFRRESCRLLVDGEQWATFVPRLAPAYLEWGLNWCLFRRVYQYVVIHAAAVERDGLALILPAASGSGKSTVCAALVHRGWRLLSDELALVSPETGLVHAAAKPICLKNESLAAIRRFAPAARFGPAYHTPEDNTAISHLCPPTNTLIGLDVPARPELLIFPRYTAGASTSLDPVPRGTAFMHVAQAGFNYTALGRRGFQTVGRLIDDCDSYSLVYSDLDDAIPRIDELAAARSDLNREDRGARSQVLCSALAPVESELSGPADF